MFFNLVNVKMMLTIDIPIIVNKMPGLYCGNNKLKICDYIFNILQ